MFNPVDQTVGWVTYVTRGTNAKVKVNPESIEIDLPTKQDCNDVSKRIHTDPNTASPTIAEIEIAITCNGKEWDRFTPGEIARVANLKPLPGEG